MNFKIVGGHMKNNCLKDGGTCCMYCKYVHDSRPGDDHHWLACSDSCIAHKDIVGKISCMNCAHTEYGK